MQIVSICAVSIALVAGCGGKNVAVTNPALEPTAILYPFEPVPVATYEGMGMAQHQDLRIAQEMARTQAMADLGSNIFDTVSSRVSDVIVSRSDQASTHSFDHSSAGGQEVYGVSRRPEHRYRLLPCLYG
jgi:hypothetical protein